MSFPEPKTCYLVLIVLLPHLYKNTEGSLMEQERSGYRCPELPFLLGSMVFGFFPGQCSLGFSSSRGTDCTDERSVVLFSTTIKI